MTYVFKIQPLFIHQQNLSSITCRAMNTQSCLIYICLSIYPSIGFPGGAVVKNPPASAGDVKDTGSIPGSGRSPAEGNGNLLQYSCLENSMGRGA